MGKKKKQRKTEDFKKVKLKVGKKLKKTATTDTTIKAKRVVLSAQFEQKVGSDDKPLSFRGLTLDELGKQLGHFSQNVRKNAIIGTKQLLTSRPDLIGTHLRTLIPSIARLIADNARDKAINDQLRSLLQAVCTAPSKTMAAHITLFLAHIFRALSHLELEVRNYALSVLSIVMAAYPELCRTNPDLFQCFVNFLGSSRRPHWNSHKFLDTIVHFLNVYDVAKSRVVECCEVEINFEKAEMKPINEVPYDSFFGDASPFDFPVLTAMKSATASPFEFPSALLSLTNVLSPIIASSVLDDVGGVYLTQTAQIIESISRAAHGQNNAFLMPDFQDQVRKALEPVRKAVSLRKGKAEKLRSASAWLFV